MTTTTPYLRRGVFWAVVLGVLLVLTLLIMPAVNYVSETARRAVDANQLRQIVQAAHLHGVDHHEQLPNATDVWDYARILADDAGLDDPKLWSSMNDPAAKTVSPLPTKILADNGASPRAVDPAFREVKPSVAVALGKLNSRMPATTPIAWTRGLQTDGTWSAHSPYGTSGGYVAFLGGNVVFYQTLAGNGGELVRHDGKGQTANIREALPPGAEIGEYTPTPEEAATWADLVAWRDKMGPLPRGAPLLFLIALWLPFIAIAVHRLVQRQLGGLVVLVWPVLFSAVLWAITRHAW